MQMKISPNLRHSSLEICDFLFFCNICQIRYHIVNCFGACVKTKVTTHSFVLFDVFARKRETIEKLNQNLVLAQPKREKTKNHDLCNYDTVNKKVNFFI